MLLMWHILWLRGATFHTVRLLVEECYGSKVLDPPCHFVARDLYRGC